MGEARCMHCQKETRRLNNGRLVHWWNFEEACGLGRTTTAEIDDPQPTGDAPTETTDDV